MDRQRLYWIGVGLAFALVIVLILSLSGGDKKAPPTPALPTLAPAKPALTNTQPGHNSGFDVVRVSPKGEAVIAGRSAPNAEVEVYAGDQLVGRTKADKHGEWVLTPEQPLPPGNQELRIVEKQEGGSAKTAEQTVIVAVPEESHAEEDKKETPLAVLVAPDEPIKILQGPKVALTGDGLSVVSVDYDDKGQIRISGRGPKGADLRIYIDNQAAGDTKINDDNVWQMTPNLPIGPGDHDLRVDQLGPDGKAVARVEVRFTRLSGELGADNQYQVKRGNNLWTIAKRTYGRGTRYVTIFQANQSQIKNPDLIYPGQILILPK